MLPATASLLPRAFCTPARLPCIREQSSLVASAIRRAAWLGPQTASTKNNQQQLYTAVMGDVVDLTLSDSDDESPLPQTKQQVPAATVKQSAAAAAAADEEERQACKRIMDFARSKAADPTQTRSAAAAAPAAAGDGGMKTANDVDGAAAAEGGAAKRVRLTPTDGAAAAAAAGDDAVAGGTAAAAAAAAASPGGGVFSNADLRALHEARMRRQQQQQQDGEDAPKQQQDSAAQGTSPLAAAAAGLRSRRSSSPPAAAAASPAATKPAAGSSAAAAAGTGNGSSISLLTYNVWFKEEVAVLERMIGLGDIVRRAGLPTFICLQEVTPLILEILNNMEWWGQYTASPHPYDMTYFTLLLVKRAADPSLRETGFSHREFRNSVMARGLRSATASIGGRRLLVATTHLESPIPPRAFYSQERQQQMAEALQVLNGDPAGNVIFAGDMNWEDKRDGAPPLPDSWVDAWCSLHPGQPGVTYDAKNNPMLPFKGTPPLRLDRVLCKLRDWRLSSIELVGTQPLPGITYTHRFRNGGSKELPVLPSDHFGLLLRLEAV